MNRVLAAVAMLIISMSAVGQVINGVPNQTITGSLPGLTSVTTSGAGAGLFQAYNSAGTFYTAWSSAATANNIINGFATSPTSGDLIGCVTASATCTLTDEGILASQVVKASSPGLGLAHFAGSTQTVTSSLVGIADLSATGTPSSTTFLRGDNTWATPSGGGGTTTNALTLNNSGSGAASGSTFNGGAAITLSYNTIGAASSGANSNITSLTGLTTPLSVAQGGTGVASVTAFAPLVGGTTSTGALQSMAAGTAKQIHVSGGSGAVPTYIDFPERLFVPSANCVNAVPGAGWSIGSGGTVSCRTGTNNQSGYIAITDTSSTFGQFTVSIPQDWDSGVLPYIRFQLAYPGTDGGSSHTIIPAIKVSCTGTAGTTSDDVTFNASHSASTITLSSATANLFFSSSNVQTNSTDMTGCAAGGLMIVQVGRATDTATSAANFYGATVTFPRLIAVQAN